MPYLDDNYDSSGFVFDNFDANPDFNPNRNQSKPFSQVSLPDLFTPGPSTFFASNLPNQEINLANDENSIEVFQF